MDPQTLLNLSEALPVEYRADIYFRLAEAGKGPSGKERAAALEALFIAARQARQKLPLVQVAESPSSRESYVSVASGLRLDEVSIRCRVVREIRRTDPEKARELFRQLYRQVAHTPGGCGSKLVFDPSLLESTFQGVVAGLKGEALAEEFSDYARAMFSGVQIPGLVRLLLNNPSAASDDGLLMAVSSILSGRLRELQDSDRAFVYATGRLRLIERIGELARRLNESGIASEALVSSLRSYLSRHLTQERCADTLQPSVLWRTSAELAEAFARVLRDTRARVEPLAESERRAARSVAPGSVKYYWVAPDSKRARDCIRDLGRLWKDKDSPGERRSEWTANLDRCLSLVRSLVPASREEEPDIFHQKADSYRLIFDMAPAWWEPRVALEEWLALFENSPLKTESPMEWLCQFHIFLDLGRKLSEEKREEFGRLQKKGVVIPGLPGPHRQAIWERVRGSKDPVVALYGMLESVAPLKWGAWRSE